jgi:hypothetical protein
MALAFVGADVAGLPARLDDGANRLGVGWPPA